MNRVQKMAWFSFIVIMISLVLSAIAVGVCYFIIGLPLHRAIGGFGFIGIVGLAGLAPVLFKKDKGKVDFDERDKLIKERSVLVGFTAAFLFTGMMCMIPFFVLGPKALISVMWLPQIWLGTFITQFFFYSLALLAQYGWRNRNE